MMNHRMQVNQVSAVVMQMQAQGVEISYAVLMFKSPYALSVEDPYINLQYSIVGGVLGLDWVLRGQRNIEDKNWIAKFIADAGHVAVESELNEVRFLRVQDGDPGDLAELGFRIATEFYQLDGGAEIALLVNGFDYEDMRARQKVLQ